jgi:transcriptional regulator with XRE-family HTH domain
LNRQTFSFWQLTKGKKSTRLKIKNQYPKEIKTIGDHLKKRGLDLGLLQKDVAKKLNVTLCTIHNWERQRNSPKIWFFALITKFLGYDLFDEPESFPESLKTFQLRMGLSQKEQAAKLGVDPGTLGS